LKFIKIWKTVSSRLYIMLLNYCSSMRAMYGLYIDANIYYQPLLIFFCVSSLRRDQPLLTTSCLIYDL